MKFLCWIWIPPWMLFFLSAFLHWADPRGNVALLPGVIALPWLWVDIPITLLYVVVRVVRRGVNDGSQQRQPYPAPVKWPREP
jgi:hypothetical protein